MDVKPIVSNINSGRHRDRSRVTEHESITFDTALNESAVEQKKQACSTILKQIDAQSEELKRTLTPEGVKKYTELVKSFMQEALSESYQVGEETSWDRSGNRKNLVIVKKVNETMAEMVQNVLTQEKSTIDMVAKMNQIRGLLVDMYF